MPILLPLSQWYCDSCGQLIEKPQDGYVEWLDDRPDDHRKYGFKIVHHASHSPKRKQGKDCYYPRNRCASSHPLASFLGDEGLVELTSWIDVGEEIDETYHGPDIADMREWSLFFRRVRIPYFEEARQYLSRARSGRFGDCNEVSFYLPETLLEIITEYEGNEDN